MYFPTGIAYGTAHEHSLVTSRTAAGASSVLQKFDLVAGSGSTRPVQIVVKSGAANNGITSAGYNFSLTAGKHYLLSWSYTHSSGTHVVSLYEEGSASAVWSVAKAGVTIDASGATDQLCIGDSDNDGSALTNVSWPGPVFGVICRSEVLSAASIETIWNGGAAPNWRDLYPSSAATVAWALGMVSVPWQRASGANSVLYGNSKIHYYDSSLGTTGDNLMSFATTLEDVVDTNSSSVRTSPNLVPVNPFDTAQAWGDFWQPGTVVNAANMSPVSGDLPGLRSVIDGKRAGSAPLLMGTLGNSRMAQLKDGVLADLSTFGQNSYGMGLASSRPTYFGGVFICNIAQNINATTSVYNRVTSGSAAEAADNRARAGFGSVDDASGPGEVYSISQASADAVTLRWDTLDPVDGSTVHDTKQFVVMLKRPNAGTADVAINRHTTKNNATGTTSAAVSSGSLSTTSDTSTIASTSADAQPVVSVAGDKSAWAGLYVAFEDEDMNYVVSAVFGGTNTTLTLKYDNAGAKASAQTVYAGTMGYLLVDAGDLASSDTGNPYRGLKISASAGVVEPIGAGYYYTDRPASICYVIQGWGGNGEAEQEADGFPSAFETFSNAIGLDAVFVSFATQGVGVYYDTLVARIGDLPEAVEVIGAPDMSQPSTTFLADNDWDAYYTGFRQFVAERGRSAFVGIHDELYDFVSRGAAWHQLDGAHQGANGSNFAGDRLWSALEPGGVAHWAMSPGVSRRRSRGRGR